MQIKMRNKIFAQERKPTMKKNLTHIVLLIDGSGSMYTLNQTLQPEVNGLLQKQKNEEGEATISIYSFDSHWTKGTQIQTIVENVNIKEVNDVTLTAGGGTPLNDALGTTINRVGSYLRDLPEEDRPNKVFFNIITDGGENESKEYTSKQVLAMQEHQKTKYNWLFMYMGCNQDAIAEGSKFGVGKGHAVTYHKSNSKVASDLLHAKMSAVRGMATEEYTASVSCDNFVTEEEEDLT